MPLALIDSSFKIRFINNNDWSNSMFFKEVMDYNNNSEESIKLSHNSFLLFKIKQNKNGRSIIYIEPPFMIKNCLPIFLSIKLLSTSGDIVLKPQNEYNEFQISNNSQLGVSLRTQGFEFSSKVLLNNKNCPEKIRLIDKDKNEATIFIINKNNRQFYFYIKAFVLNETNINMFIYSKKKESEKKKLCGGQFFNSLDNDANSNKKFTIFNEEDNLMKISEPQKEAKYVSLSCDVKIIGEQFIELKNNEKVMNFGVKIRAICLG